MAGVPATGGDATDHRATSRNDFVLPAVFETRLPVAGFCRQILLAA